MIIMLTCLQAFVVCFASYFDQNCNIFIYLCALLPQQTGHVPLPTRPGWDLEQIPLLLDEIEPNSAALLLPD